MTGPETAAGPPVPDLSPEARRKEALRRSGQTRPAHRFAPGTRARVIAQRVIVGIWNDGFIHAGNFAYMAMVAIFPFFTLGAAMLSLFGEAGEQAASLTSVLEAFPPSVREVLQPVAEYVINARSGWLLWAGAGVALWTVGSLVETIRDVLRRAYGTRATQAFWRYRLITSGVILASVVVLIVSLFGSFLIESALQAISVWLPELGDALGSLALSRIVPAIGLFASLYFLFLTLTPTTYRSRRYPKWPGPVLVTLWVLGVTLALPRLLKTILAYDLTYGSLAGIMIALFFFWLVGIGIVAGAELNAALATTPEEEGAAA
jgi:membrane protein